MPHPQTKSSHRRVQSVLGLTLALIFYLEFTRDEYKPILNTGSPVVLAAEQAPTDRFAKLIREDPLAALIEARGEHVLGTKDYRCTMVKQELLASGMGPEQEIEVLHRLAPYSVALHWTRNAGLAARALYVEGRWTDADEKDPKLQALALCQPDSEAARLLVKSLKMPIHGKMARRTARRSIDEFGFKRTLDLLIHYCEMAKARGELGLRFCGDSHFDARPVWVVRRTLPYTGEHGPYPDRTAEIYIDKEYRVPIAVYCYSDDAKQPENLLGKYEYRDIRFDAGLTETDFDPTTYGM